MKRIASLGTIKERRALISAVRDVVPVALDMFQLGREDEIHAATGHTLAELLRLALADYRDRYTDTRREELVRRDLERVTRRDRIRRRTIACLFCSARLAQHATTRQSHRISTLMTEPADADDRVTNADWNRVQLIGANVPLVWCAADARHAIRPHVVVCALASLGRLRVPKRPDAREDIPALFDEARP